MVVWSLKAIQQHIFKLDHFLKTSTKCKIQKPKMLKVTIKNSYIPKSFKKLYVKYKSNPVSSYCDIKIQ